MPAVVDIRRGHVVQGLVIPLVVVVVNEIGITEVEPDNLKHVSELQEERVPLGAHFSESRRALLIGDLDETEGGLEAVRECDLDVSFVDGCIDLIEELQEKVFGEILIGHEDVDPGAFFLRVRIKLELG